MKKPFLSDYCSRESAANVSEELTLEQCLRDSAAVDRQEYFFASAALAMHGARYDFFSNTTFSGDENGGVCRRDLFRELDNPAHGGAFADEVFEIVF